MLGVIAASRQDRSPGQMPPSRHAQPPLLTRYLLDRGSKASYNSAMYRFVLLACCASLIPCRVLAAPEVPAQLTAPAPSPDDRLKNLEGEVAKLRTDFAYTVEISRLRDELKQAEKPWWVHAMPWAVFGGTGIAFALAVARKQRVDPDPLKLKELRENLESLSGKVVLLNDRISLLMGPAGRGDR